MKKIHRPQRPGLLNRAFYRQARIKKHHKLLSARGKQADYELRTESEMRMWL